MAKDERDEEFVAYFCYIGKRFNGTKLEAAFIETDAAGKQIAPSEGFYVSKKFPYAKRPTIGAVYKVYFTSKERTSLWIADDWTRFVKMVDEPRRVNWLVAHTVATGEFDKKKDVLAKQGGDVWASMTLGELSYQLSTMSAAQRRVLIAYVLDYLKIG